MRSIYPNAWAVLTVKGYQGLGADLSAIHPKRHQQLQPLSLEDVRQSDNISQDRVIVENYFGWHKTLWSVCADKWRWDEKSYDLFFRTCVVLANAHAHFVLKKATTINEAPGLSNDHTYLRPGKTKKDVRGVDYFVGAEELMKYLDKVDLDAARQAAAAPPRSGAAVGTPKAVEEVDSAATASTDATATLASAPPAAAPPRSGAAVRAQSPHLCENRSAGSDSTSLDDSASAGSESDANSDDVVAPRRNLNDDFNEADGGESSPQPRRSARIAAITSASENMNHAMTT
ncbi:hypothetical protein PR002_g10198 [Phytophthora rubi]|uniref:DDE Tnp4 domain-containing protein n=1 Tax=Phytophthora rubi TaxID=129364 RepID=A0A6A3MI67_9STRA|nr:hypothetical protein PR002_g10198 [Phytophthora rubi]